MAGYQQGGDTPAVSYSSYLVSYSRCLEDASAGRLHPPLRTARRARS